MLLIIIPMWTNSFKTLIKSQGNSDPITENPDNNDSLEDPEKDEIDGDDIENNTTDKNKAESEDSKSGMDGRSYSR